MKKISKILLPIILLLALFILTGCNDNKQSTNDNTNKDSKTSNVSTLTFEDVNSKFEEAGYEVNLESKPYYQMIGAEDGELFYLDSKVVKLYKYKDEETYKKALEEFSILENMPKKDLIVLDTSSDEAIQVFNSL